MDPFFDFCDRCMIDVIEVKVEMVGTNFTSYLFCHHVLKSWSCGME